MMVIDNKFNLKQLVYLKTDTEQKPRIITAITITQSSIIYDTSSGIETYSCYDFELTAEKNILASFSDP